MMYLTLLWIKWQAKSFCKTTRLHFVAISGRKTKGSLFWKRKSKSDVSLTVHNGGDRIECDVAIVPPCCLCGTPLNTDNLVIARDGLRLIHLELIIVCRADGCWGCWTYSSVWCIMHLSRTSHGICTDAFRRAPWYFTGLYVCWVPAKKLLAVSLDVATYSPAACVSIHHVSDYRVSQELFLLPTHFHNVWHIYTIGNLQLET